MTTHLLSALLLGQLEIAVRRMLRWAIGFAVVSTIYLMIGFHLIRRRREAAKARVQAANSATRTSSEGEEREPATDSPLP
ncbi:MAG: hypothetical protein KDB14_27815 [Planctomycetales bacterium]|nr:hypothetical protein [Planctomycetales bacterium]